MLYVLFVACVLGGSGLLLTTAVSHRSRRRAIARVEPGRRSSPLTYQRARDVARIELVLPLLAHERARQAYGAIAAREPHPSDRIVALARLLPREAWTHVHLPAHAAGDAPAAAFRVAVESARRGIQRLSDDVSRGYRDAPGPSDAARYGLVSIVALTGVQVRELPPTRANTVRLLEALQKDADDIHLLEVSWAPEGERGYTHAEIQAHAPWLTPVAPA